MLQRRLMGVGLTRGHDIIRVVVVRDGLALGIGDLARDGGKLILRKGILEHEGLAVGRLERAVRLLLIDDAQSGGIVDRGSAVEILQLRVVNERQADEGDGGDDCADEDKRCAAAALAGVLIRDRAEQRQQKQRQDVVERHDDTGPCLRHTEFVGQDQRDGVVVGLPERADQEKGKANADGAFVVELHRVTSKFVSNPYHSTIPRRAIQQPFDEMQKLLFNKGQQTGGSRRQKEDTL